MSIIVPPPEVIATLGRQSWGQQRYDFTEESDVTGAVAVNAGGSPPRWRASIASARGMRMAEAGAWQAMVLKLEGRRHHLALYDLLRAAPQGTLRGALSLGASAAAGATSLALAGGSTLPNLLGYAGFEVDTDANGLADGLSTYSTGTVTGGGYSGTAGNGSTRAQIINATALGTAAGDAVGFRWARDVPVTPGLPYTLAVDVYGEPNAYLRLYWDWYTADLAPVGTPGSAKHAIPAAWQRVSATATAPATAAFARVFMWVQERFNAPVNVAAALDNAQFEQASAPSAYASGLATLLPGDLLQLGTGVGTSQLVSVVDPATADANGNITATVRSAARIAFASATAVAWSKPLAYFRAVNAATNWASQPNGPHIEGFDLDLLEDWNA